MNSRRTAKLAQAIREVVSSAILFHLKDPRVKNVTVTNAEVSGDLRNAKIYVSVMGDESVQSLSLHGLNSARGFLQSKVAERLQTRYTPILKFVLDTGVQRSFEASRLIDQALHGTTDAEAANKQDLASDDTENGSVELSSE